MNHIEVLQNEPAQLQKLAAQRELYSAAKRRLNAQIAGGVGIPIVLALVSILVPAVSVYSALYACCFFVIDAFMLEPAIKALKAKAAKIQELFDGFVLDLKTSPFKTATDVTVDEVLSYYDAHAKVESNVELLRNWFDVKVEKVDISVARLICQRINYSWDCRLRESFSRLLKWILVLVPLLILISGFLLALPIIQATLIITGLLPLFRFLNKLYQDNTDAKLRLSRLNEFFNKIWERILANDISNDELGESARRIQDEIYENRVRSPLIPDMFYRYYRPKQEDLMLKTGDTLVSELKEHQSPLLSQ